MSFEDKTLTCSDCTKSFTFSAEEQEQFQSRGYTNEPKRCPECRQARKAERFGNGGATATETIATAIAATVPRPARCSRQYALIAARKLQYRSSPARADRYTAATATAK